MGTAYLGVFATESMSAQASLYNSELRNKVLSTINDITEIQGSSTMANNSILFTPFHHKNIQLPNRIVMAPMTRSFSPGHVPNEQVAEYYRRRAAHGVGLVITEGTCIDHPAANGHVDVPFIYGDKALVGWRKVIDAVHSEGGKIIPQLWHVGAMRAEGSEPNPRVPAYSPSGLLYTGHHRGHVMTKKDIKNVVDSFSRAGKVARDIGFDGVEIHGAHGYLIDQFFWDATNRRDDEYGGSIENRSRFAAEIIKAIRHEVGADFLIALRWSQWKMQSYTARLVNTPEQLNKFLRPLIQSGVDIFHCSTHRYWEPAFADSDLSLAGWTRKLSGHPTITVGSVGMVSGFLDNGRKVPDELSPESLDDLTLRLENEEFDLVAVGRALIADMAWPEKVQTSRYSIIKPYKKEMLTYLE